MTVQVYQRCTSGQLNLGREGGSLEYNPSFGHPATTIEENIVRVHHMVIDDGRLTINQTVAVISTLSNESGRTNVSARRVLCFLTPNEKYSRLITAWKNLTLFETGSAGFHERNSTRTGCSFRHLEPDVVEILFACSCQNVKVISSSRKVTASCFEEYNGYWCTLSISKRATLIAESSMSTCRSSYERQSGANTQENWGKGFCFMRIML